VGFWLQEHGLHACRVSFGNCNCCSFDCCFHCHMQILISSRILVAGTWLHAGYHLTTAIAAPSLLSLPYAFSFLGWAPGLLAITICGLVSSYAYCLLSQVLDDCASKGHRFYRFRELSQFVIGNQSFLFSSLKLILTNLLPKFVIGNQSFLLSSLKLILTILSPKFVIGNQPSLLSSLKLILTILSLNLLLVINHSFLLSSLTLILTILSPYLSLIINHPSFFPQIDFDNSWDSNSELT